MRTCLIPFNKVIADIDSLINCDNAIDSLSVLDKLISDCSFDSHEIRHPAYVIIYPVLENTEDGFSLHDIFQSPAKDAST